MRKRQQRIYIDAALCAEALGSKDSTEGLALALLVKLTFVNSRVECASVTRMMGIFGIGFGRCRRAVEAALRCGYLRRDGEALVACRLRGADGLNYCVGVERRTVGVSGVCRAPMSLTQACDIIRGAAIACHVARQQNLFDTLELATVPEGRGGWLRMKSARRKLGRLGMRAEDVDGSGRRLSYASMMERAGCSRSKARLVARGLVAQGVLRAEECWEATGLDARELDGEFVARWRRSGLGGFPLRRGGSVQVRRANEYFVAEGAVRWLHG